MKVRKYVVFLCKSSIIVTAYYLMGSQGGIEPVPVVNGREMGERLGTAWMFRLSIAGLHKACKNKHAHSLLRGIWNGQST